MSVGNFVSDIGAALGDTGKYSTESLVKNPVIEGFNQASQRNYQTTMDASKLGLENWIRTYLGGNVDATRRANQEIGGLNQYWNLNGGLTPDQQNWMARYGNAANQANALSKADYVRSTSGDRVMGGGGDSSYLARTLTGNFGRLNNQNILNQLAAEKAMRDQNEQIRLGTIGQRTAIANADAARLLAPGQASQGLQDWSTGAIGRLSANDLANHFYGVKYNPSGSELAGNIVGDVYSGYGGGGGNSGTRTGTNWGVGGISPAANQYTNPSAPGYVTQLPSASSWSPGVSMAPATSGWSLPSAAPSSMPSLGNMWSTIGGANPYAPVNFAAAPSW